MNITEENMVEALILAFPELKTEYVERCNSWSEPGEYEKLTHAVYGYHLNHYLIGLIKSNGDREKIKKIFNFLEKLASSDDKGVLGVMEATVCWKIMGTKDAFVKSKEYMGPNTLKICRKIRSNFKTDEQMEREGDDY